MRNTSFGYNDPATIRDDLQACGFGTVDIESVQKIVTAEGARDAAIGYCQGGSSRSDIEMRDPGGLECVTNAVTLAIEGRFGTGPITVSSQALFVTAGDRTDNDE